MKKPPNTECLHVNLSDKKLPNPLFFSFWCIFLLFYSKFCLVHGIQQGEVQISNVTKDESSNSSNGLSNSLVVPVQEIVGQEKVASVLVELNISVTINDSVVGDNNHAKFHYSVRGMSPLEDLISTILNHTALVCKVPTYGKHKFSRYEDTENVRMHLSYPDLDEYRNITKHEKELRAPRQLASNVTQRLEPDGKKYNYASAAKGAKVVDCNKEAKGADNILGKDHDKYLINPCSAKEKYFVIELADAETLVDAVKMANFEHYSSNFKEFELYGSLTYPTETWNLLGKFVAANGKNAQYFELPEPKWLRYLMVRMVSHYGSEFYCTLSSVEVYGVDAIEQMLEDFIETSVNRDSHTAELNNNSTPSPPKASISISDHEIKNAINLVNVSNKEFDNPKEEQKLNTTTTSSTPEPSPNVRQVLNGRIHSDAAIKVLLQKVRTIEQNLSVLEEYIKKLNKVRGDFLPELAKELSELSLILEKTKSQIRDLLDQKKLMEKNITDLESWRAHMLTQLEWVVRENGILRLDVEKVETQQARLENREFALVALGFSFACIAVARLIADRFFTSSTSHGWMVILVSSITIVITLICY